MTENPYQRFQRSDLILRDELAIDRTVLANERTLLSYIRTALAFAITGAGIIHFFASPGFLVLGWCMALFAVLIIVLGVWRFRRVAGHISMCRNPAVAAAGTGEIPRRPARGAAEQPAGGAAKSRAP